MFIKPRGYNVVIATVRNAAVENCQMVVEYAHLFKKI
jgi:hypothetical protein